MLPLNQQPHFLPCLCFILSLSFSLHIELMCEYECESNGWFGLEQSAREQIKEK